MTERPPQPDYTDDELAALDGSALIEHLCRLGDRAPRNLIDACAARGDAMVQILENLLEASRFWQDDGDDGGWWLRLHAAMILGLIASEGAGRRLVSLMRRLDEADDQDVQDWLSGQWSALFANKPAAVRAELRALAEERTHDWYMRINAAEAYLSSIARDGGAALDAALDWAAGLAADEQEDRYFRLSLGNLLLDLPRDRHRPLLEALAARQTGLGKHFDARDVELAYARGRDAPHWERFADPWALYQPGAIAARQERWAEEDRRRAEREDVPGGSFTAWHQPYVRQEPRIGRNDPCPCGSGKKYKKCCLGKERV